MRMHLRTSMCMRVNVSACRVLREANRYACVCVRMSMCVRVDVSACGCLRERTRYVCVCVCMYEYVCAREF